VKTSPCLLLFTLSDAELRRGQDFGALPADAAPLPSPPRLTTHNSRRVYKGGRGLSNPLVRSDYSPFHPGAAGRCRQRPCPMRCGTNGPSPPTSLRRYGVVKSLSL